MAQLRVSEIYNSIQGEGHFAGTPTLFLRFAGCNMRCPGWPCDTEHAINPKIWRIESVKHTPNSLLEEVIISAHQSGISNICLTGGEPFMQPKDKLEELCKGLEESGFNLEVFTNGSYVFPSWSSTIVKMMDWKLEGSGEADTDLESRLINALNLSPIDGIKFVCTGRDDLDEAKQIWGKLVTDERWRGAQIWVGSAWDKLPEKELVEWLLEERLPWKLNVQVHKYIWPADERGV